METTAISDNHSIAYCLLGYLCAYYRYYYPVEYTTAYLNNAANDDDIANGTLLAKQYSIKVTSPKFGISQSEYQFDKERKIIAKGLGSVKFMSKTVSNQLFEISQKNKYTSFIDLLSALYSHTQINARQVDILIKIDFFSDFGNQRELLRICDVYEMFKRGDAKQIKKEQVLESPFEEIIKMHSVGTTKSGAEAKSYVFTDLPEIMRQCEGKILSAGLQDLSDVIKVQNFTEIMGYAGYTTGKEEDRRKLYVREVFPVKRKKDGKQFGVNILTQSIGSGKESKFTVFNREFNKEPIQKGDVIVCVNYTRDGQYFTLKDYKHIY